MSVQDIIDRFRYRKDPGKDEWSVLDLDQGLIYGDCEDFALTVAFHLAGRSWIRFWIDIFLCRSVIWYCTTARGEGHAMLWRYDRGWIDNIYPEWRSKPRHKRWFPYWGPLLAIKWLVA